MPQQVWLLYTLEASALLNVTVRHVERLANEGTIAAVKRADGKWYIIRDDLLTQIRQPSLLSANHCWQK